MRSAALETLRNAALATTPADWAAKEGWTLQRVSAVELAGPCPVCGGTDRFSINTRTHAWNCRKCGVGGFDVIFLVQHTEGLRFTEALERITGQKAGEPVDAERTERLRQERVKQDRDRSANAETFRERARHGGFRIWQRGSAQPWDARDPVAQYLDRRGISVARLLEHVPAGPVLRQIMAHDWRESRTGPDGRTFHVTVHTGAAMLACVQRPDGTFGAVHQTWIDLGAPKGRLVLPSDENGRPRPTKKVLGAKQGGAIRLHTPPDARRMVMGEGIETTLTALAYAYERKTAYWAGVDLGNMAGRAARDGGNRMLHAEPDLTDQNSFLPPPWVEELVFLCDGDDPEAHTIEKVQRGLKRAQAHRPGLRTAYVPPLAPGKDLNDLVRVG